MVPSPLFCLYREITLATPTPEQQAKIDLVRLLVGDTPGSIFYPIMTDDEYYLILEFYNWDVMKAARRIAISISLKLSQTSTRERTGDIEVWNSAATEYAKALDAFLNDPINLPDRIKPFVGGISKEQICEWNNNPDAVRSPLTQISPCAAWWTKWDRECCDKDSNLVFRIG